MSLFRVKPDLNNNRYSVCSVDEEGLAHCDDGPAVIHGDGTVEWYRHGVHHRIDGPAIDRPYGRVQWMQNGVCHRLDGPAMLSNTDPKHRRYYLHGRMVTRTQFANNYLITFLKEYDGL